MKKLVEKSFYSPELNIVKGYSEYENMYLNSKIESSLETFYEYNTVAPVPRVSSEMSEVLPSLALKRREAIAKAVKGQLSIDDAIRVYEEETEKERKVILQSLNN
jgi:hypothetical protein